MMKLTTVAATPISAEVDGTAMLFHPLTMGDMAALSDELFIEQQSENAQTMKHLMEAGIKQDQLPMVVRELGRRPAYSEVRHWVFTVRGAVAAVARAARNENITKDTVSGWLAQIDIQELAAQLVGFAPMPVQEDSGTVPLSESATRTETG